MLAMMSPEVEAENERVNAAATTIFTLPMSGGRRPADQLLARELNHGAIVVRATLGSSASRGIAAVTGAVKGLRTRAFGNANERDTAMPASVC